MLLRRYTKDTLSYPGRNIHAKYLAPTLGTALVFLLVFPSAVYANGLQHIPVCHGFGCRFKESVSISEKEWNQIKAFFREPAASPADEREQIRRATGWFEVIVGRHTPTHYDRREDEVPGNFATGDDKRAPWEYQWVTFGQMDCIDEARNLTTYLTIMEKAGLFQYHEVVDEALRQTLVGQHFAAQIEEIDSGARWVLDSWFYGYGILPNLSKAKVWHDIRYFGTAPKQRVADTSESR